MNRFVKVLAVIGFLVIAAHRLPAPIQETPESTPTPKPRREAVVRPNPKPEATAKPRATLNRPFAGTWSGIVGFKDPFVGGGGDQQCDFVINAEETSMMIRVKSRRGSYHTATTPVVVIGNTLSAKGGFFKHMNATVTLTGDGTTADVLVRDTIWGSSSGTLKKIK
jgi:hypothetical protein